MDEFKNVSKNHVGVGGWSCPCCGPKPGKDRDAARRRVRRVLKQKDRKLAD